eukprot:10033122-Heterocapsa_arctica.AAC.1
MVGRTGLAPTAEVEYFRATPARMTVQLAEFEDMRRIPVLLQLHGCETEHEMRRKIGRFWAIDLDNYCAFLRRVMLAPALDLEAQGVEEGDVLWISRVEASQVIERT